MKKSHKKYLVISSLLACCTTLAGWVAPVKTNADTVSDFDCSYSASKDSDYLQYGSSEVITYTAQEAEAAGIPAGYTNTVLSVKPISTTASGCGILLDFSALDAPVSLVEQISFRFYIVESANNTGSKPQLRIMSPVTKHWTYQPGDTPSVTGEWATETVVNTLVDTDDGQDFLFSTLADADGNLDKFELSLRVTEHVPFYIDRVTLTMAENDGVAPEIRCPDGDNVTIALGSNLSLNASAYDAQEKCEKTLEYVWEDGVELNANGTPTNAGEYSLTLRAVDHYGNTSEKTITVTVVAPDLEKPVISPNFTEMYAQVGMIPNLTFQVTDNQKLASVTYAWSEGALNQYGALTEGTHTYTITAQDTSNNVTVLTITVFVTQEEHVYDDLIDEEILSPRFTVTFDGENGTVYKYGEKVKKPADPVREDTNEYKYVFDGWYNGNTAWDFDKDVVTADISLVAKWTEISLKPDDDDTPDDGDTPGDNPSDNPGSNPSDKPSDDTDDKPGDNIGDNTGDNAGDNPQDVTPEQPEQQLGFFARIWQAIINFFKSLFGIKE